MTDKNLKKKLKHLRRPTSDLNRKFYDLYNRKALTDVILSADGHFVEAHKVILTVASSWFEELFDLLKDKHPVIVLRETSLSQLHSVLDFIYLGSTNIPENEFETFTKILESLRISTAEIEYDDDENTEIVGKNENEQNETANESHLKRSTQEVSPAKLKFGSIISRKRNAMGFSKDPVVNNVTSTSNQTGNVQKGPQKGVLTMKQKSPTISKGFKRFYSADSDHKIDLPKDSIPKTAVDSKIIKHIPLKPSEDPKTSPKKEMRQSNDPLDIKIKDEPTSEPEICIQTPLRGSMKSPLKLPPNIQLKRTPRISSVASLSPTSSSSPLIRIRTPASINEKVDSKAFKIVQRSPTIIQRPPIDPHANIGDISKRLSKAILIRRVKKQDGSFVNEQRPIKIIQGMKISKVTGGGDTKIGGQKLEKRMHPIFRCSHCTKAFTVNKRRNAHEKFCFKNPARPASQCPFCSMQLCNPSYITTHIRKVHGIDENGKHVGTTSEDIEEATAMEQLQQIQQQEN